jgi:hypothetical protein
VRAVAVAFRRTAKYRSVFELLHPSLSRTDSLHIPDRPHAAN